MTLTLVHLPLLHVQRELYALPRGRARFEAYIARMTSQDGDLRLPLTAMNPMADDHLARAVEGWLSAGAEDAAAEAIAEADSHAAAGLAAADARAAVREDSGAAVRDDPRAAVRDDPRAAVRDDLPPAMDGPRKLQVGLVVADDVRGGWTNRFTTDFANRFESQPLLRRGFAVALLWASEAPDAKVARREALRACGRGLWQASRGFGRSVRELLTQEHFALRFSGETPKPLPQARFLDQSDPATVFAVLYGDEAATAIGHPALGIAPALQ